MGTSRVIRFPGSYVATDEALMELVAAIELVASGGATRVVVACLPGAGAVAAEALSLAQAEHVRFRLVRAAGSAARHIVVGPVEA